MLETTSRLLERNWVPGVGVRLLGVGVSGFSGEPRQLDLLESNEAPSRAERRSAVERAVDDVRARFGGDSVDFGRRRLSRRHESDRSGPRTGRDAGGPE